jgi:hypothetical protein
MSKRAVGWVIVISIILAALLALLIVLGFTEFIKFITALVCGVGVVALFIYGIVLISEDC